MTIRTTAVLATLALLASSTTAAADDRATVSLALRDHHRVETRARPRHARMALETAGMLAIGTAWYWRPGNGRMGGANVVDWQLGFHGSSLTAKLGMSSEGWRFDGNSFGLNAVGHPIFGALTFFNARRNGYGMAGAFVASTLASGAWEMFTEWAEYGSINDILSTSPTGVPLGEAAYQLVHHWRQARYVVASGVGSEAGANVGTLGVGVALDTTPRHGAGVLVGGRKVDLGVEVAFDGAVRSIDGSARTSLVGYHRASRGRCLFAGATAGFTYHDRKDRDRRPWDLLATVGVGPTVDVAVERGGLTVAAGVDVHGEFGMVRGQAFDAWRAMHPTETVRNSMQDKAEPYYYAAAVAVKPRITLAYHGVDVGGRLVARRLDSLEGADRDQELVTADPDLVDNELSIDAAVGYSRRGVRVSLARQLRERTGSADAARGAASDRSTMLTVSYER